GTGADPSARISASAQIEGNVWIGRNATIGDDVTIIGPSVIGDHVCIDRGARIESSILWQGASAGEYATVKNAILGMNFAVASNETLDSVVVANEAVAS